MYGNAMNCGLNETELKRVINEGNQDIKESDVEIAQQQIAAVDAEVVAERDGQ